MSINEALRSVCPSLSVKIALGVGLFNNALLAMGTERHNKYYEAAWKGEVCDTSLALYSFSDNDAIFLSNKKSYIYEYDINY